MSITKSLRSHVYDFSESVMTVTEVAKFEYYGETRYLQCSDACFSKPDLLLFFLVFMFLYVVLND
jgi:hypothetical protein